MKGRLILITGLLLNACGSTKSKDIMLNPLNELVGNVQSGAVSFAAREGGHCVLCHTVNSLDAEFQGNVGPNLSAVGSRLSAAQLRLRIVDYDRVKPGATMPSYYRTEGFNQAAPEYAGKTLLPAQDIEDIIAYLGTLKDESL